MKTVNEDKEIRQGTMIGNKDREERKGMKTKMDKRDKKKKT